MSQQEIANHFSLLWKLEHERRTVGDIVADAAKLMSATDDISSSAKMLRHARHGHMGKALYSICGFRAFVRKTSL